MKKQSSKYYVLLLLIATFAAPGIAAYLFYQHPGWLSGAKVNRGELLNPPVTVSVLPKTSKWHIVFWSPEVCDKACLKQLDTLARIRLALGRKLYQVDQWLVLSDKVPALAQETKAILKELDFQVAQMSEAEAGAHGVLFSGAKVFLANPDNYLILSYSSSVNPDDVYKDLKLLLTAAENKSS